MTVGATANLTLGHIKRHVPPSSGLDEGIAVLDIAQDFLLAHLHQVGLFELVSFKGGTALRKLFAGSAGRFSTDLDFASADIHGDRTELAALVAQMANVSLGPFTFKPAENRGRWRIGVTSGFGNPAVSLKLDVGPPGWRAAEARAFVEAPIQQQYGFDLPPLPCMPLDEVIAEKVARLTRVATARDAADLVWIATTSPHSQINRDLVRTLSVVKVWVDNHGLGPAWSPALNPAPFSPEVWLTPRRQWDDEQIGMLARPAGSLQELEQTLFRHYAWLAELSAVERDIARAHAGDRKLVFTVLRDLVTAGFTIDDLY